MSLIDLSDVTLRLGGRLVLDGVSLSLEPGEFVGVIGPNGAGKSTLLQVMLGLLRPSGGSVRRREGLRIGYVPQRVSLDPDLPLRARDLVSLGLDGHRWGFSLGSAEKKARVSRALDQVRALDLQGRTVGRLSGGELQRLLIAQALVGDPDLLLLDEPLDALDLKSSHQIVTLVARMRAELGVGVALVTHDMNPLLAHMDRIVYLARGRCASGTVREVARKEVLSRLYGYEVEVLAVGGRILISAPEEGDGEEDASLGAP